MNQHTTLSQEVYYYTDGGEPPGQWTGRGAERLGLSGEVDKAAFHHVFDGYSPDGQKKLVQSAGQESHRPGWDLTFSAPKSVSTLWAISDSNVREIIQAAHFEAVKSAVSYLEDEAAISRTGKGGAGQEKVTLVVATFEHGTSRAQDPQLHTHALVLNVGVAEDGLTRTLESKPLFQHKMAAGALYRAELSRLLQEHLEVGIERKGNVFEVRGVPQKLVDEFSTRRAEIEKVLAEKGLDTAKAAAVAALDTRETKGHVARGELFGEWRTVGAAHAFGREQAHGLCLRGELKADREAETRAAFHQAREKVTLQSSHFSERDITRALSEEAPGKGLSAKEIRETVKTSLASGGGIIRLGMLDGETRYTTAEMLALERRMMDAVERSSEATRHAVRPENVIAAAKRLEESSGRTMSAEQQAALRHLADGEGSIKAVSGMAGTGKTFLLQAAREAWEAEGYEVRGAALAGKAADGLETDAGIPSMTVARFLKDTDNGKSPLSAKTVLVVDEAGMIDTRQMSRLVDEAGKAGAKLVLVGDAKQLQPIEAGGPFKAITERIGAAELTDIRRQSEEWARTAVKDIAAGNARAALTAYAEHGQLTVAASRERAHQAILADWKQDGITYPKQNLLIANTRLETTILNRMAQAERNHAGELGSRSTSVGGEKIHEGDRVLFTRNSNLYGVRNGNLATVERVSEDGNVFHARLDSGRSVTIPTEHYEHVKLGYAVTTHKGQGVTVDNAFVLAGGEMQDLHQSYVQLSRGRGVTRVYTTEEEAGEDLKDLAREMNRSRQKDLALSLHEKNQQQEEPHRYSM